MSESALSATASIRKRVRRLFKTDYCLTPVKRINHSAILCENENIIAVGGASAFSMDPELEVIEIPNAYLTPGFFDTHIHGAGGFDASSAYREASNLELMSKILSERGVTSFVPTVVALEHKMMLRNLEILVEKMRKLSIGADAAAIHIEGPFINPCKRGAQIETAIQKIDLKYTQELIDASGGLLRKMTFAPELEGAVELIELLCANNITASMGHSIADENDTLRAIDAGARCCTHLFNGMAPVHQRNISLTNVALTDDRVAVELIIDGRHINPRMIDLTCRCKKMENIIAISDATMAAGMPNGHYWIGPTEIVVEDGFSHTLNGLIAGTTTLLDTGWHSLMSYGHLAETTSATGVTMNPARSIGFHDRGILQPNMRADLAIFECGTNRPLMTVRRGEIVYRADK